MVNIESGLNEVNISFILSSVSKYLTSKLLSSKDPCWIDLSIGSPGPIYSIFGTLGF